MKTYWVNYRFEYDIENNGEKSHETDGDGCRFHCLKKNIKKEVEKKVMKDLEYLEDVKNVSNIKFDIEDCYETTDDEL